MIPVPTFDPIPNPIELTADDRRILALVEPSLARGVELHRWWQKTDRTGAYAQSFDLQRKFNPSKRSLGFFDRAKLSFGEIPVLGVVQEMTFDFSPLAPAEGCDQMRNFVLRYLLRVSDYERPSAFSLRDLRRDGGDVSDIGGFGYSQCYYKVRGSGRVGKFPPERESRIVDIREIGKQYEWVVFKARLFGIELNISPTGDTSPHLEIPVAAFTEEYLITSAEFIVNEEAPAPGVLGRYAWGCATLHDPAHNNGPLLWGPGRFDTGFAGFVFDVLDTGETVVTAPFVVNRPERIFGVNPDPISIGVRLADMFSFGLASRLLPGIQTGFDPLLSSVSLLDAGTGGWSSRLLGLSVDNVERYFLAQHFMAIYEALTGVVLTYCQIPDWTAPEDTLPEWVREGRFVKGRGLAVHQR